MKKLTIGHIYPQMLNLYGDIGNVIALKHRITGRGIEAEVKNFDIDDTIDFSALDIVFIGGGGDREQAEAAKKLSEQKKSLSEYTENDGVLLAVCGGFELLGEYYTTANGRVEGAGILPLHTEYNSNRLIGNIIVDSTLLGTEVVGFENHNGRVVTDLPPLGKVLCGHGHNDGGTEGAVYKNVVATYMHGPLLPKNPALTDHIILSSLKKKYGDSELAPMDSSAELAAHDYAVGRFLGK